MPHIPDVSKAKICLIDGYLDEPSCLGVPPYISPQIRYVYGALLAAGVDAERIEYRTIDQIRKDWDLSADLFRSSDLAIVIAGATVPGRYLGGRPISRREIEQIGDLGAPTPLLLGGPIVLTGSDLPAATFVCTEVAAASVFEHLTGKSVAEQMAEPEDWAREISHWAVLGASLTTKHPNYPYLVCELETFRGCPRAHNCAFCTEARKRIHYQRRAEDLANEVAELHRLGNRYFRIGCQTDLFLYGAHRDGKSLHVNPAAIKELYQGVRAAAPDLKVLHMDNANPATLMRDPEAAAEAIATIADHNTPGDVAAFGLESADPKVLAANLVETDPDETLAAVKLMNDVGGWREGGIPKVLPGLNLIHGLIGETKQTMDLNFAFLQRLLDAGLMVRRINIRQVLPHGNYKSTKVPQRRFQAYKERVNQEINRPMLQKVFPFGTVLAGVHIEQVRGTMSFGRQLGSYPILVGIPGEYQVGDILQVRVIDHGFRSITALPTPFLINRASIAQLEALPGMGRKRAMRIFLAQPISGPTQLQSILGRDFNWDSLLPWIEFEV